MRVVSAAILAATAAFAVPAYAQDWGCAKVSDTILAPGAKPQKGEVDARKLNPPLKDKEAFIEYMVKERGDDRAQLARKWDLMQNYVKNGTIKGDEVLRAFLLTAREEFSRARAPAKVERGQMKSLAPVPISFTLTVGVPPHPEIRVEKVYLSARVPANLGVLSDGLLGGAVPVNTLAQTENPYCKTLNNLCQRMLPNSTLIDLIASILQPDIDLDVPPDGLEALTGGANGRIAECRDGNGQKVDPIDSSQPWTCALQAEIADGYSVGITFSGVAATVVGVGQ